MGFNTEDILEVEKLILPEDKHFSEEGIKFLNCDESKEVLACPGSGKTTLLMAKLYLLSKSMPFANNAGICVLSHTNVAVEEIKNKLGTSADKILTYPNYVGTIQSFVDKFVVFPYLTNLTETSIQVMDDNAYAKIMCSICNSNGCYSALKYLLNNNESLSRKYNNLEMKISNLYIDENGKLKCNGINKCIAGQDKKSTLQFVQLKKHLLLKFGAIKYKDAYDMAGLALKEYGEELKNLISKRFRCAFIDEYQDCDSIQTDVLDTLFSTTILQKIGDVDQAIYGSTNADEMKWNVSENAILLSGSNRYNQKNADFLTKLRTNKEKIVSLNNSSEYAPTLIVFGSEEIKQVIPKFLMLIQEKKLREKFPSGQFKIIGMIKRGAGLKISDYIEDNCNLSTQSSEDTISYYIDSIISYIVQGDLHKVELILRQMILKICKILDLVDDNEKTFTLSSIKIELKNIDGLQKYSELILSLVKLNEYNYKDINDLLLVFIKELFNDYIDDLSSFLNVQYNAIMSNVATRQVKAIPIETVHKVKGETHTATLYLETETSRNTDIKRILPLLEGKRPTTWTNTHEKTRKIVYVGLSRASQFLCLAVQSKTYDGNEKLFDNWDVIDLRDSENRTN